MGKWSPLYARPHPAPIGHQYDEPPTVRQNAPALPEQFTKLCAALKGVDKDDAVEQPVSEWQRSIVGKGDQTGRPGWPMHHPLGRWHHRHHPLGLLLKLRQQWRSKTDAKDPQPADIGPQGANLLTQHAPNQPAQRCGVKIAQIKDINPQRLVLAQAAPDGPETGSHAANPCLIDPNRRNSQPWWNGPTVSAVGMILGPAFRPKLAAFWGIYEHSDFESQAVRQGEMGMTSKDILSRMRGFTLIEMSIVLVVIGLLLSGGLLALAPVLENAKRTETNNTLTKIDDTLTLHAIQYGCMPCPADGDIAATVANAGLAERNGTAYYANQCVDDAGGTSCRGLGQDSVVPWITLGLQESDILDGWGNRINYHLTATVVDPVFDTASCPATTYTSGIFRCGIDYPADTANYLIVTDTSAVPVEITNPTERALYVLVSQGPDGDNARSGETGTVQANPANTATQNENTDGDNTFVQGGPIGLTATYFDDIVRWKTAPIFIQGCGEGGCGNPPVTIPP